MKKQLLLALLFALLPSFAAFAQTAIIYIPQGEQGPVGDPGQDGADGLPGAVGPQGPPGDAGLSAYQIAQNNGYVGTEQEWLETYFPEQGIQQLQQTYTGTSSIFYSISDLTLDFPSSGTYEIEVTIRHASTNPSSTLSPRVVLNCPSVVSGSDSYYSSYGLLSETKAYNIQLNLGSYGDSQIKTTKLHGIISVNNNTELYVGMSWSGTAEDIIVYKNSTYLKWRKIQ